MEADVVLTHNELFGKRMEANRHARELSMAAAIKRDQTKTGTVRGVRYLLEAEHPNSAASRGGAVCTSTVCARPHACQSLAAGVAPRIPRHPSKLLHCGQGDPGGSCQSAMTVVAIIVLRLMCREVLSTSSGGKASSLQKPQGVLRYCEHTHIFNHGPDS